jgi:hypothetical protein
LQELRDRRPESLAPRSLFVPGMARKRAAKTRKREREDELLGPPPGEATIIRTDREREAAEHLAAHTNTSPELSAGDVDANWERAASVGEEAPGGTVATPDQDVVDEITDAWGVPRAPDEEFRTSAEILESRDRYRAEQEDTTERE